MDFRPDLQTRIALEAFEKLAPYVQALDALNAYKPEWESLIESLRQQSELSALHGNQFREAFESLCSSTAALDRLKECFAGLDTQSEAMRRIGELAAKWQPPRPLVFPTMPVPELPKYLMAPVSKPKRQIGFIYWDDEETNDE